MSQDELTCVRSQQSRLTTGEFIPAADFEGDIVVYKYIDAEFIGSIDTPLFDSVFDFQFTLKSAETLSVHWTHWTTFSSPGQAIGFR